MANIIYTNVFGNNDLFKQLKKDGRIVNTLYKGKESENSYCFKVDMKPSNTKEYKERLLYTLKENFGITDNRFDAKFYQAINGAGQEWGRINVVHSSSLLPLLCFYSVSEQKPLEIPIAGKVCKLTTSEFEVANEIGKNKRNNPYSSHIDVKLTGLCEGKSISLYLESKFCEYVNQRGKQEFTTTEDYNSIYSKLSGKINGLDIVIEDDKISLIQNDKKRPARYLQGIKQMVSHYLGMKKCKEESDIVYLGEILYDFRPFINDLFDDYEDIHRQLVNALEEVDTVPKSFNVVKDILTYQDVFRIFKLDKRVKELYYL
jgi:hypothetical protein